MLLGVLIGDLFGGDYEGRGLPLGGALPRPCGDLSDDSILTIATAWAMLQDPIDPPFEEAYRSFFRRYPDRGYGQGFEAWASDPTSPPRNSWANGAAMRVSPISYAAQTLEDALILAHTSCLQTHNHPEAILAAQLQCGAVYLFARGSKPKEVRAFIKDLYPDFQETLPSDPTHFTPHGLTTVSYSLTVALQARTVMQGLRVALSLGGDCDTITSMTMACCEARFGLIEELLEPLRELFIDPYLLQIMADFETTFRRYTS